MQRKNNLLKRSKNAMALIMAIAAIVVVSTILTLALMMNSQTTKSTTEIYLYEQANLLARSAAEYAIFKIGNENNSTARCTYPTMPSGSHIESFVENGIYTITISVKYVYSTPTADCSNNPVIPNYAIDLAQEEDFGAAMIDVTVEVPATIAGEPIRVFKRKLVEI